MIILIIDIIFHFIQITIDMIIYYDYWSSMMIMMIIIEMIYLYNFIQITFGRLQSSADYSNISVIMINWGFTIWLTGLGHIETGGDTVVFVCND